MSTNAIEAGTTSPRARELAQAVAGARWPYRLLGYAAFLGLWQFASTYLVEPFILPTPWTVLGRMWEITSSGALFEHFGSTIGKIAIGFTIAFVVGLAIGILMGLSRWWHAFFGDWVLLGLNLPGLIYALLMALIFGLSSVGPIVAIVACSYPFVTVNVVEGVRALPRELLEMSDAYRVSRLSRLRHVILPALAPFVFTSLRYGFSIAWKITTLTEVFGGTKGIGFMMRSEFQQFSMAGFLAWALCFFAFALFLERVLLQQMIERSFRWRAGVQR